MAKDTFTLGEMAEFEKAFQPAAKPAAPAIAPEALTAAGISEAEAAQTAQRLTDWKAGKRGAEPPPPAAPVPDPETPEASAEGLVVDDDVDGVDTSDADPTAAPVADDSAPAASSETETPPAKPKGKLPSDRIKELVAQRNALKQTNDYLQQQLAERLAPQQPAAIAPTQAAPPAGAQPVAAKPAPTLESVGFDTDKWTQAMHAWTQEQIAAGVHQAVQTVQHNQTESSRQAAFRSRMDAFGAQTPDFQVTIGNPSLPQLAPDAASIVVDSELAPRILYYLGKNVDKAVQIARQSPVQQAAAIGRLEAELKATKPIAQKTTPNITRAPAPPTPTSGRGNSPSTDPSKMSTDEWIEWDRRQTVARKAKR